MSAPIDDDAFLDPPFRDSDDFGVIEVGEGALPGAVDADVVYDDLDAPAEVIIKTLTPARGMSVEDLDQPFVQQKLLADGARHWAPVLRSGPHGSGLYVAVPYFPKSVQKLLSQRVPLTGRQLYEVLIGVLKGLAELKKTAARPHGNLKPSNILLQGGRLREKKVRLTDPAPTLLASKRGYGADLYRVGELIHQLVLFRPPRGPDAWPVPRTPEWDRLGKSGEKWRDLCGFLLSPQTDRTRLRIVDIARKVRAIHPRPLVLRPSVMLVASMLIGIASFLGIREYARYAHEWAVVRGSAGWIPRFEAGVRQRQAVLAMDEDLREHLLGVIEPDSPRHVELDLAHFPGADARRTPLPSASSPPLDWHTFQQTRAAYAALIQLQKDLMPDRWKTLGALVKRIPVYDAAGFVQLPEFLKRIATSIESGPTEDTPQRLEEVLWVAPLLDRLDAARDNAARQEAALSRLQTLPPPVVAVVEPIRKRLRAVATDDASAADLTGVESLAARLHVAAHAGAKLISALPRLIELAATGDAYSAQGWPGPAKAVAASISGFDPDNDDTGEALNATRATLARIDALWARIEARRRVLTGSGDRLLATYGRHVDETLAAPLTAVALAPVLDQLQRLDGEQAWAAAERFVKDGEWAKVDAARFTATSDIYKAFATAPLASNDDVNRWLAEAMNPRFRIGLPTNTNTVAGMTTTQPAVAAVSVATIPPAVLPNPTVPPTVVPNPTMPPVAVPIVTIPPTVVPIPTPPPPPLLKFSMPEAQALVAAGLAKTTAAWEGLRDRVAGRIQSVAAAWEAHRAAARRLETELITQNATRLHQLLSQGYALDDAANPGDGITPRKLLATLQASSAGRGMIAPLTEALQSLAGSDARAVHRVAAAEPVPLGLRLSAWQQLTAGPKPARSDFETDVTLCRELLDAAKQLDDPARRTAVREKIETAFRPYWLRFLAAATKPDDIAYGLSMQDLFGALDESAVDETVKFDLALKALRASVAAAKADPANFPQTQELSRRLLAAAAALPTNARLLPEVATLTENLRAAVATDGHTDFAQLGPLGPAARERSGGRISWKAEADPDGSVVTYRAVMPDDPTSSDLSMVFRRVDTSAGPFYLCTTETSLGLFADVITQTSLWGEIKSRKLLWDFDPFGRDPRVGPRVWEWSRSGRRDEGIVRALVWLSPDWLPAGVDHYPESLGREFNRTALRPPAGEKPEAVSPSRRMPMQMVSPQAANYFAALVGCRLPTAVEWKAAYAIAGKPEAANLRDHSWLLELQHLNRPALHGQFRPDAGMFVPVGEPPTDLICKTPTGAEYDDGVLWFREVVAPGGSPLTFQHLAGNVGEFVQDSAGKVYVIGGSALSPPQRPIDKEFEVDPATAAKGYSDVGFRLAFSGPPKPIDRLIAAMPDPAWYLAHPAVPKP